MKKQKQEELKKVTRNLKENKKYTPTIIITKGGIRA